MFGNVWKCPEQSSRADWCVEECRMLECGDVLGTVGTPGSHRPHVAANTGYLLRTLWTRALYITPHWLLVVYIK